MDFFLHLQNNVGPPVIFREYHVSFWLCTKENNSNKINTVNRLQVCYPLVINPASA